VCSSPTLSNLNDLFSPTTAEAYLGEEISSAAITDPNPEGAVAFVASVQGGILGGRTVGHKKDCIYVVDKVTFSIGMEVHPYGSTQALQKVSNLLYSTRQCFSSVDRCLRRRTNHGKDNHSLGRLTGIPPAPRACPKSYVTFQADHSICSVCNLFHLQRHE
jgi:molecular chaperone DnaK (HSP70)